MILLPPEVRFALRANDINRRAAASADKPEPDAAPLLKLFNPLGAATWLATELGYFSLSEIRAIRLPYGLWIERQSGFETPFPLSVWADTARHAGSILWAETILRRAAESGADPDLPIRSGEPGGG